MEPGGRVSIPVDFLHREEGSPVTGLVSVTLKHHK